MIQAADLSIETSVTALDMANAMFGAGVTVVSATYSGDALSSGIYSNGEAIAPNAVPADTGVILSTGLATAFTNSSGVANQSLSTSTDTAGIDGDVGLNGIAGVSTYDAAILDAEFIPTGDTLTMQLVFSSEEYLEWVNSGYNDAVGIWVNGEKAELAIGDGDISIDNINTAKNSNLFVDNAKSAVNSEMDGLTITLTIKADVIPGEVNTVRFGIADAGDSVYDSNLLIVGDSVQTQLIAQDDMVNLTSLGETVFAPMLNDTMSTGGTVSITKINGNDIQPGDSLTLGTGEVLKMNADGTIAITATGNVGSSTFTYTIENENGTTDTAYVTLNTDPVDGTEGDDSMTQGHKDADGNQIDGADGNSEVILGYGGNDKIFAGEGIDHVYGGTGNDFIRAHGGDDIVYGGDGNDVLDGGEGNDAMTGGDGNDIYYVDTTGDSVTESANQGHDKVYTMIDYVLGDDLEDLWLEEGAAALVGTANDLDNLLVGNELGNTLSALDGDDRVMGLGGDDTIRGGGGMDTMDGNDGNDSLYGEAGADKLTGGGGNDLLDGGIGGDLLCAGFGDDTLIGGAGNDHLDGGFGTDYMAGGGGNDVYFVYDSTDITVELSGEGRDEVKSTVSWVLDDNFENLTLSGSAMDGSGNGLDNRIYGNGAANTILGLGGNDDLRGFAGDDLLNGGAGNDRIQGGSGNDTLMGGEGADRLIGGGGDNILNGGLGDDFVFAGVDADEIHFAAGDGSDVVGRFDIAADKLVFTGISADDLITSAFGTGTLIETASGDSLYLSGLGEIGLDDLSIVYL